MSDAVVRKELTCEVKKIKGKNGQKVFRFVGSTEAQDRGGDIVDVKGWDTAAWEKNPVILWGHNHSVPPIGRGVNIEKRIRDKKLVFDVEFAPKHVHPFAGMVEGLVDSGFVKAVSVGFIPKKSEDIDEKDVPEHLKDSWVPAKHFKEQELIELSVVSVGMNPEALQTDGMKSIEEFQKGLEDCLASFKLPEEDKDGKEKKTKEKEAETKETTKKRTPTETDGVFFIEFDKSKFQKCDSVVTWLKENGRGADNLVEREMFFVAYQRSDEEFVDHKKHYTIEDEEGVYLTYSTLKSSEERLIVTIAQSNKNMVQSFTKAMETFTKEVEELSSAVKALTDEKSEAPLRNSRDSSNGDLAEEDLTKALDSVLSKISALT